MMNDEKLLLERDPEDAFDRVLRTELRWQAPPELSLRLLALVPGNMLTLAGMEQPARPKAWFRIVILVLTAAALGLSFAIAAQIYGSLAYDLGFGSFWEQLQAAPAIATGWLFDTVPGADVAVSLLVSVRDQLYWLLAAIILWIALDGWTPTFARKRVTR